MHHKVSVIGGGGVRTPLLIHGLLQSQTLLGIGELQLFDVDMRRAQLMASMGREIAQNLGVNLRLTAANSVEEAVDGCDFVLSSLRVGGMAARARDERIAIEEGLAGQETTGPGGVAMATMVSSRFTVCGFPAWPNVLPDARRCGPACGGVAPLPARP